MSAARKRVLLALGGLAIALVGTVVGYAVAGGGDDDDKVRATGSEDTNSTTDDTSDATDGSLDTTDEGGDGGEATVASPATVPTDGLEGAALELANATNRAATLTYHAVYEGDSKNKKGDTTQVKVEVWRQLPLARRDTTITSPDGTLQTRELRLLDQLVGCVDTQKGDSEPEWMCVPSEGKGVDPAEPVLGTARPTDGAVTVRDDVIAGVPSRCFSVADTVKVAEVCFDAEGIPVSIDGGDGRLERTEVGRGVDPDTVTLPEGASMRPGEPAV